MIVQKSPFPPHRKAHRPEGGPGDGSLGVSSFTNCRFQRRFAKVDRPCQSIALWTITARVAQSTADRGYAASRESAMADFKAAWQTGLTEETND